MSENSRFYEFSDFWFDPEGFRLECRGEEVHLPPKSLKVLKLLLEHRDRVVERDELIDDLWEESFVEEANLTVTVSRLRKALSDHAPDQTFIQTVPKIGYRFVGGVSTHEAPLEDPQAATAAASPALRAPVRKGLLLLSIILIPVLIAIVAVAWRSRGPDEKRSSQIIEAEQAFLRGNAEFEKRLVCESIPYLKEATERDLSFARAFARLAAAQAMCPVQDGGVESLKRAMALDPNLVDAHAVDGFIKMSHNWDWNGAEVALHRAVELDPQSAMAHHWLGVLHSIQGRLGEARGQLQRSIDIDPRSPLYHADLCQIHYFMRNYEFAENECKIALEIDPNFYFAQQYLRDLYLRIGNEKAAAEIELARLHSTSEEGEAVQHLRAAIESGGFDMYWRVQLERQLRGFENTDPNRRTGKAFGIAWLYANLSDKENTLKWLTEAAKPGEGVRAFRLTYVGVDPVYDHIRDDPRYRQILALIGLEM
ncbi:MAG: winged helix-turn-helix domain-containing protein [Pyrinomonadaceae bacterium]